MITDNQDLKRDNLFLTAALDALKTAVITTDKNNYITSMNSFSTELLECTEEEVIGKALTSVLNFINEQLPVLDGTDGYNTLLTKKGRKILIEETIIPVIDEKGNNHGSVLIIKEISIDEIGSRLVPFKVDLGEFKTLLYSLVHEINNIFSVNISNTEVLAVYLKRLKKSIQTDQNIVDNEDISDFICKSEDLLKDNTEVLAVLTEILENANDFLLKESYQFQEIMLESTVNDIVVFLCKMFGFTVETIIDIRNDVTIEINRSHLNILLRNIIHNAYQSCEDRDNKRVRISGILQDKEIIIIVEDTGIGIPADVIPRIFDPYFTTKQKHITNGLGLAICKNIVDFYNGSINIHSKENQGTKIEIKLPIGRTN